MNCKTILNLLICSFLMSTSHAQNCDPWIKKIYSQLYGRTPNSYECSITNYNKGSWNGFDQLREYIRGYNNKYPSSASLALNAADGKCMNSDYYGICTIAEFKNNDFPIMATACGQAAAVTALWHAGLNVTYKDPAALAQQFYQYAPPKITIAGLVEKKNDLGTDWRQIENGLNAYSKQGIRYNWQKGKSALQNELRKGNTCLIMLDIGTLPQFDYKWGGHWVVAYGYDNGYVYVTNFKNNRMSWDQLHKAWGGSFTEGHLCKNAWQS